MFCCAWKGYLPGVESWLTLGVVRQARAIRGQARAPALTPAIMKGVVWPGRRDCSTSTTNTFDAKYENVAPVSKPYTLS